MLPSVSGVLFDDLLVKRHDPATITAAFNSMKSGSVSLKVLFIKILLRCMAALPLRAAHGVGALLGNVMWHVAKRSRRTALRNLALCFPGMGEVARRQLARASMVETGKGITELGALWFWPVKKTLSLIKQISGEHYIEQAVSRGEGVIFVSPHLGAWELSGLYCAQIGGMTSLYRPPKLSGLDSMMRHARERGGARLVPTDASGVRALLQGLRRGEFTGILPDQDPGFGNGEFAPFFGVQANTMTLLSKLAFKSKAPVILIYAQRLPKGEGFHLHLTPIAFDYQQSDMFASLVTLNQSVEEAINELPQQYLWSYKRFKSRPLGEESLY